MRFSSFHPGNTGVEGSAPSSVGTIPNATAATINISSSIAADGTQNSYLSASWAALTEATSYDVEIDDGESPWTISSPTASIKWIKVSPGRTYKIRIKGSNKNGLRSLNWSAYSNIITAPGDAVAPGLVTGITAVAADFSSIVLSWTNPADTDLAYVEIRHSLTNSVGSATVVGKISGTTFTHAKRAEGTTNYYWLRAIDKSTNPGSYAAVVSVTMPSVFYDTVPATVSGTPSLSYTTAILLDGTAVSTINGSWTAVTNAASYLVEITNTTTSVSWSVFTSDATLKNVPVTTGQSYNIKVKAVNSVEVTSPAWSTTSATVLAAGDVTPPSPVTITSAGCGVTNAVFYWTDPTQADYSHVKIYGGNNSAINSGVVFAKYVPRGGYASIPHGKSNGLDNYFWLVAVDYSGNESTVAATGALTVPIANPANNPWTLNNQGSGTGMDSDLLDGYDSTAFPRKAENATVSGAWTFANSLTTGADVGGLLTLGRYSSGYAWTLVRPDTAATGFEFRSNAGTALLNINQSSGNIGISNASPAYRLDVNGDINFTGTLRQNGTAFSTSQWTTTGSNIYYNTGKVGIATASPFSKLSNTASDIIDDYGGVSSDGVAWSVAMADKYVMAIQNDHIYGGGLLIQAGNDKNVTRRLLHVTNGDDTSRFIVKGNGYSGFGIATPDSTLHVLAPGSVAQLRVGYVGGSEIYADANTTYFRNAAGSIAGYFNSGNLYVNGSILMGGNVVWTPGNDGPGSGLDADLWDGYQFSNYLNQAVLSSSNVTFASLTATTYGTHYGTSTNVNHMNSTRDVPSNSLQYWQASGLDSTEAPTGDWHNTIRMGHGNPLTYYGSTLAIRMTGAGVGDIYTQSTQNGSFMGWKKHWNDGNDGSGSGLDADLLDGIQGTSYARLDTGNVGNITLNVGSDRYISLGSSTNYSWQLISAGDHFQIREAGDAGKIRLAITYPNGFAGFGTSTPGAKLHVKETHAYGAVTDTIISESTHSGGNSSDPAYMGGIRLSANGYDWGAIRAIQNSPAVSWANRLAFYSMDGGGGGLLERMCITNAGNVGINTISPGQKLEVNGNVVIPGSGGFSLYTWTNSDTNWRIGMSDAPPFSRSLTTAHVQYIVYAGNTSQGFAVGNAGGASGFEIRGGDNQAYFRGNVGMGTGVAPNPLTIESNTNQIRLNSSSDSANYYAVIGAQYNYSEAFVIKSNPGNGLRTIFSYADAAGILLSTGSASPITLRTNGTDRLTVSSEGTSNFNSYAVYVNNGRGVGIGYSGGNYGSIGYNVGYTTTSNVFTAQSTDTTSKITFNSGGITVEGAGTGGAGRTVTYTQLLSVPLSGNMLHQGSTVWTAGNDGAGSGLDADLLDGYNNTVFMVDRGGQISTTTDWNNFTTPGMYGVGGGYFTGANNPSGSVYPYGHLVVTECEGYGIQQTYYPHTNDKIWFRTGWSNGSWQTWREIWTSATDGTGSGLDADLLRGVSGSSYMRTDSGQTISAAHDFTSAGIQFSGHNYHNTYDGTTIYENYYPNSGSSRTAVQQRVRDTGGGLRSLILDGNGTMSWAGEIYVQSGSYFRAYGTGGFYCQDYNGGWNMTDGTWIRSIADKGILTGGAIQGATVTATSDRRLKSDIQPLTGSGEVIDTIATYSFLKDGTRQWGVIAQEVLETPAALLVHEGGTVHEEDGDAILTVDYNGFIAALLAEVKELRKRVALLEEK